VPSRPPCADGGTPTLFGGLGGHDRIAYRVCACRALEAARRAEVPEPVETLRRLLSCAAWIEGHATHLHLIQVPGVLGYVDAADLAKGEPQAVTRGLELHRAGAELATAVGDDVLRVGGPRRPTPHAALIRLSMQLADAVGAAMETADWISGLDIPESGIDVPLLALDDPVTGPVAHGRARYPIDGGVGVLASNGLGFPLAEFESFVSRPRAGPLRTGRAALCGSKATLTGPLARNALCARFLHPAARSATDRAKLTADERNPYRSAMIRAVELVHALEEAEALIGRYEPADQPYGKSAPVPGHGRGFCATESPSGLLYQRYDLRPDGTVGAARLIGPDELNRTAVELDLRRAERTARHRDPAIDPVRLAEMRNVLTNNYEPYVPGSLPSPSER
jgi:sulfhydrogenase subunit alpha